MKLNITVGNIIGIIISIAIIIGGLTGGLVLRGTNSSIALVVVGILFLLYDISKLFPSTEDEDEVSEMKEVDEFSEEDAEKYFEDYYRDHPQDISEDQTSQYIITETEEEQS